MTDYKAVCSVANVEDFGINFYSGTIVIDGSTRTWRTPDDPEKRKYMGRLTVNGVSIRKRKDYKAIHAAVNEAIRETVNLMYSPHPQQESQPQLSAQQMRENDYEDDGLRMQDVLGI